MFTFKVKFDSKVIFSNELCEVSQLSVGGVEIGYVHLDHENLNDKGRPIATSFNTLCILSEHDDAGYASTYLFSGFTRLPEESIKLSTDGVNSHSIIASLALAKILTSSFKG